MIPLPLEPRLSLLSRRRRELLYLLILVIHLVSTVDRLDPLWSIVHPDFYLRCILRDVRLIIEHACSHTHKIRNLRRASCAKHDCAAIRAKVRMDFLYIV